ncbi:MAG TPA: L,D-transpeptidase family protein [Croceibacterium sp.]|nr:L,D-transpeptidase family protein [Croceibacterium sp.]
MRLPLAATLLLLLAGCGFNGTDPDDSSGGTSSRQESDAEATENPDFVRLEEADIPDSEPRRQMQLQVVLDRQGFGPGIIDGKDGLSTANALKGFQEAHSLAVTGRLDDATREALSRWQDIPATRVVRIPDSWGEMAFRPVPEEPEDQATMDRLGYESLDEKLAERFHTTVEVLEQLNPGGRPAGQPAAAETTAAGNVAAGVPAYPPRTRVTPTPRPSASETAPQAVFRAGQLVRVPNVGFDLGEAAAGGEDRAWLRTLASLGVAADQPEAARIVVDKSEGWLKAYDATGKLVGMFTVTSGSQHDPLPLGEWTILGVSHNPPFHYNPDLFWDAEATDEKATLPPGPNGPVGVVWIDLSKEHYGIHGTPEPQSIGRSQSHGCVRLTNWDAARLAGMVSGSTKVIFQA